MGSRPCSRLTWGCQPSSRWAKDNIGLALAGVISGEGLFDQRQPRIDAVTYLFGKLANRELMGIAQIDGPGGVAIHQADQAIDQIVDITKRTTLAAIAIEGDWLTAQGLHDEIAHHTAIVGQHARTVGVEDARDADLAAMHALVIEAEGFSDALALVVTGADADRIHETAIALRLGMHVRIAIHLTSGGQQQASLHAAGQAKHVVSAEETGFGGFDRVGLVMNRRSGAGEVPDAVNFELDRLGDVVANELKARVIPPLAHIGLTTCEGVIETEHLLTGLHQSIHQMGTEKTSTAGDQVAYRTGRHRQLSADGLRLSRDHPTAIPRSGRSTHPGAGAVIQGPRRWQPLGGVTPKGTGPAATGLKVQRKEQHLEALPLEQALGAAHVEGTGDQQDAGTGPGACWRMAAADPRC